MKKISNKGAVGIVVAGFAGLLALLLVLAPKLQVATNNTALGSVTQGNEYSATSTRLWNGTALANLSVLKTTPGTLGSVIITGVAAGTINIYDATSTITNTEWSTTTAFIATIPNSAATGTYTFDIALKKGLLLELLGTVPTTTVTFR